MNDDDANQLTCERVIGRLDEAFDEGAEVAIDRDAATHLAGCGACREVYETLVHARARLGELPTIPFPDDALADVWARTVDGERSTAPAVRWYAGTRRVALAASLAFALAVSWFTWHTVAARQDREARAVAEARYVLALTAGAVRRVEAVAVEEVLENHVGGALKNLTNQWTQLSKPLQRRSGT